MPNLDLGPFFNKSTQHELVPGDPEFYQKLYENRVARSMRRKDDAAYYDTKKWMEEMKKRIEDKKFKLAVRHVALSGYLGFVVAWFLLAILRCAG